MKMPCSDTKRRVYSKGRAHLQMEGHTCQEKGAIVSFIWVIQREGHTHTTQHTRTCEQCWIRSEVTDHNTLIFKGQDIMILRTHRNIIMSWPLNIRVSWSVTSERMICELWACVFKGQDIMILRTHALSHLRGRVCIESKSQNALIFERERFVELRRFHLLRQ